MEISNEQIKNIADLSKLEFSEAELKILTEDMNNIVNFAKKLNEINVDNIKPTAHILELNNVFREDIVNDSYDRKEILKNAPSKELGCISVPKTVE